MSNAIFRLPEVKNDAILEYRPGSKEKTELLAQIKLQKSVAKEIPMVINGKEVHTNDRKNLAPPHEIHHSLGHYSKGTVKEVKEAIQAAQNAKADWANANWEDRAAIFLKAADLISGKRRNFMNASTMLAQSKNVYQSEIDAIGELADFFRFNVQFMIDMYSQQPKSSPGVWNRLEYRPLEGFVFAITPFNFTAISGNLPGAPALMGNTVVWKPAESQIYAAHAVMSILQEAGLPDGVINLVYTDGPTAGRQIFSHKDFGGLHFTGSTGVFNSLWKTIGDNISNYVSYPRIVGETGGKDFILAHPSAEAASLKTALIRGSFEFQGQKCSAASRAYIPKSLWKEIKDELVSEIKGLKMGSVEDFSNYINAVIDEKSFDNISGYIDGVKNSKDAEILVGGKYEKSEGYFIEPTIVLASDPKYKTMCEEIFGPVLSIYVYEDKEFDSIVKIVDSTSPYALTGSIFAGDRSVIDSTSKALVNAAGNFYINDKPTGAVVGQQPFGGGRASGTNDKAGSIQNLYRWVSPRTIKETFVPPTDYRYPFLGA